MNEKSVSLLLLLVGNDFLAMTRVIALQVLQDSSKYCDPIDIETLKILMKKIKTLKVGCIDMTGKELFNLLEVVNNSPDSQKFKKKLRDSSTELNASCCR